jgi:coproporphyrinogen III oxidase-like Fe-S oxidoreductase
MTYSALSKSLKEIYLPYSLEFLLQAYQDFMLAKSSLDYVTLYIHTPYCLQRCSYCMYQSNIVSPSEAEIAIDSGIIELERQFEKVAPIFSKEPIRALYFGGGSSSLYSPKQLEKLFVILDKYWDIHKTDENMLAWEGHPSQLYPEQLEVLSQWGINRFSIGIQSLDPIVLQAANRLILPTEEILATYDYLKEKFLRVNVDLIYGLQKQTFDSFIRDITTLTAHDMEHITLYGINDARKTRAIADTAEYRTQAQQVFSYIHNSFTSSRYAFAGSSLTSYNEFNCLYHRDTPSFRYPYGTSYIPPFFNSIIGFSMTGEMAASCLTPLGISIIPSKANNQLTVRGASLPDSPYPWDLVTSTRQTTLRSMSILPAAYGYFF